MRQQKTGLGPPADSRSFKVSQVQGHLPALRLAGSLHSRGWGWVVQSHQWASALQLNGGEGPRLDL